MRDSSLQKAANKTVTDYIIWAVETLSDGQLIAVILKGLPEHFKPNEVHITQSSDDKLTFGKFKVKLRSYENTEKWFHKQSNAEKSRVYLLQLWSERTQSMAMSERL